jgi:hypothetical protein
MSDKLGGDDLLTSSVVDVSDLDGEIAGLFAVRGAVDECWAKNETAAEVAPGLERCLPRNLAVDG